MPLDRSMLQSRLNALQSRGTNKTFEKIDYTKIYWKPRLGEQTIRIVPSKYNKDWPFKQVQFHRDIVVKTMYALTNWGEKDPIVEFVNALKAEAADKKKQGLNVEDEYETIRKLRPKPKTYAQVLVRGEEHMGVRLWEFGSEVEEQLLNILNNSEYGDVTDINEGTDLLVVGISAEYSGNKYVKPSITPKRKSSPLAENAEQLQNYLNNQNDPLTQFKRYTYDEVFANLKKWLEPEGESDVTTIEVPPAEIENIDDLPFIPDPPKVADPIPAPVSTVSPKKAVKKSEEKKPLVKEETKVAQEKPVVAASNAAKNNKEKFNKLFPQ
jgi:hypothetical protein